MKPWKLDKEPTDQEREMLIIYCMITGLMVEESVKIPAKGTWLEKSYPEYVSPPAYNGNYVCRYCKVGCPEKAMYISFDNLMELLKQEIENKSKTQNMKVLINDVTYVVTWRYIIPEVDAKAAEQGFKPEDFKGKGKKKIAEMLGMGSLPSPSFTHCIIDRLDEKGERHHEVESVIRRYHSDVHNPEKARKFSLAKALRLLAGGEKNIEVRRKFWNAYITRKPAAFSDVGAMAD
jgi:hypothetical protein